VSNEGSGRSASPALVSPAASVAARPASGERQPAEESRDWLTAIVDSSDDAIIGNTIDGAVVIWNKGAERLYGYTASEVVGKPISILLPPDRLYEFSEIIEKLKRGESLERYEAVRRAKDGRLIDVSLTVSPIRDALGQVTAASVIAHDITEHKRVEESPREREARFRLLFDHNPLPMVVCDRETLRFLEVNDAFVRHYGYSREELLAMPIMDLHAPEDRPIFKQYLESDSQRGTIRESGPWRHRLKDGRIIDVQTTGHLLEWNNRKATLVVAQDVTVRKQAEEATRKAKEAAEAADRLKGEFLTNMRHEMRTPMNGILGMAELALDTELTREQREFLEAIKASADNLLTIVNDLLNFSKIDAGRLGLEVVRFNLRDSLGETIKLLAPSAHRKGLKLTLNVSGDVPEFVHGDPARLRQIIVNLVGNAIKFTERGEVVLGVDTSSATGDCTWLHFMVRDTGIGIPRDKQEVIFKAFIQADASLTRKFGGTGLGLAIAAALIQKMAGRIWVESEVGLGSEFHFTARFGTPEPAEGSSPAADASKEWHRFGLA
jgi:two-component system, sensor histidine kinase and response regulator